MKNQILIGGQALRELGSDRFTNDFDYLINDTSTKESFITSKEVDYLNANGNKFFAEIFEAEKGNTIATPKSLLELKAFAFVQHCQNFNWEKVDSSEYDIKFLVRTFGLKVSDLRIIKNYISNGVFTEIENIINNVK